MSHILLKALRDSFSKEAFGVLIKSFILTLLFTGALLYFGGAVVIESVHGILASLSWEWLRGAATALFYVMSGYMLFIAIYAIISSFFIEPFIVKIATKHYPSLQKRGSPSPVVSALKSIKSGLLFLILYLFTFPLLFVPLLGAIWLLFLWAILIKEPTAYDVGSLFFDKKLWQRAAKSKRAWVLAMIASAMNFIPVLNLFAPLFVASLFLHYLAGESSR